MLRKINPVKFALRLFNGVKQFFLNPSRSRYITIGLVVFVLCIGIFGIMRPAQATLGETLAKMASWILMPIISLLGQLLLMMINLLIGVAQYNDFINATAVVKGWVIIRDVCNMFFIVLLLYVAFCLVLGIEKYGDPKKTLVSVLIMAILINFSRMICGLIIDFAQVIMMTFVNAFKDAAAGNITTGLGLQEMLKFREGAPPEATANPSELFVAMLLGVGLLIIALVVMTIITLVLFIRIIVLWILILLSPLAFMAGLVPFGKKWSSEWWSKFTNQVIVGPVLAFFLWLALSLIAAQPGDMGLSQEFTSHGAGPTTAATQEVGAGGIVGGGGTNPLTVGISNVGQSDRLLSFVICIVLLVASLIAAQQMGVAGGKMAGAVAGKIQAVGAKPFKKMGEGVKGFYKRNVRPMDRFREGRAKVQEKLADWGGKQAKAGEEKKGFWGGARKVLGKTVGGVGGFGLASAQTAATAAEKRHIEEIKKKRDYSAMSPDQLKAHKIKGDGSVEDMMKIEAYASQELVKEMDPEQASKAIASLRAKGKERTKGFREFQKYHFDNDQFTEEEKDQGAEMLMRDKDAFNKVPVERMSEGFVKTVSRVADKKPKMADKLIEVLEKDQIAALNKSNDSNLGKAMGDDLADLLKAEGKSDADIDIVRTGIRNGDKATKHNFIDAGDEAAMAAASPREKKKAELFKKYSDEVEAGRKWGRKSNKGKKKSLDYYKKLDDKGEVEKGSVIGDPAVADPEKGGYGIYAADLREDMGKVTKPEDIKKMDPEVKKEALRLVNSNIMLKGWTDGTIDNDTVRDYLQSLMDAEHGFDMNFPGDAGTSVYTERLNAMRGSDLHGAKVLTMMNEINSTSDRVFKTRSVTDNILRDPNVSGLTGDAKKQKVADRIDEEKQNMGLTVPIIEEKYGQKSSPEKDKAYRKWSEEQAENVIKRKEVEGVTPSPAEEAAAPQPLEVEVVLGEDSVKVILQKDDVVGAITPEEKQEKIANYIGEERVMQGVAVPEIDQQFAIGSFESAQAYRNWDMQQAGQMMEKEKAQKEEKETEETAIPQLSKDDWNNLPDLVAKTESWTGQKIGEGFRIVRPLSLNNKIELLQDKSNEYEKRIESEIEKDPWAAAEDSSKKAILDEVIKKKDWLDEDELDNISKELKKTLRDQLKEKYDENSVNNLLESSKNIIKSYWETGQSGLKSL